MNLGKVILGLQVAGFAGAVTALVVLWNRCPEASIFVAAFAVHMAGDLILVAEEGLPNMPFDISKYVKLAPWLQFVGLMLAVGGLLGLKHWFGIPVAYLGIGVSFAGFVYDKIYP